MVQLIDIDDRPLRFGKYRGQTPNQVADFNPSYIIWLYENIEPKICSKELYQVSEMEAEEKENEARDLIGF